MLGFGIFDDHKNTSRRKEYDGYEYKGGPDSTEEFAIDGKSWNYRDPNQNTDSRHRPGTGGRNLGKVNDNINSYKGMKPLYDYSYGQIRDAAGSLGIKNIDEKSEIDTIIKHIQAPKSIEPDKKKSKPKKPKNDIPDYMDASKPIQLSNKAANAEATITAHSQRFDSPASQTAYDLKDKYALDLKSGLGQRGQGVKKSSGWDNGMSQSFADNKKKLIAQNLQPGWNQATMGA